MQKTQALQHCHLQVGIQRFEYARGARGIELREHGGHDLRMFVLQDCADRARGGLGQALDAGLGCVDEDLLGPGFAERVGCEPAQIGYAAVGNGHQLFGPAHELGVDLVERSGRYGAHHRGHFPQLAQVRAVHLRHDRSSCSLVEREQKQHSLLGSGERHVSRLHSRAEPAWADSR